MVFFFCQVQNNTNSVLFLKIFVVPSQVHLLDGHSGTKRETLLPAPNGRHRGADADCLHSNCRPGVHTIRAHLPKTKVINRCYPASSISLQARSPSCLSHQRVVHLHPGQRTHPLHPGQLARDECFRESLNAAAGSEWNSEAVTSGNSPDLNLRSVPVR